MNMEVSKNWETKFETLFRNHNALFPNFFLTRTNIATSIRSAIPKAVRLASAIRADCLNIKSYADSFLMNRTDGVSQVAKSENKDNKKIMIKPDRMMLRVLLAPYTSVITSLMENTSGNKNIATLALRLMNDVFSSGNVFPPITSEATIQKIYKEIRKSSLLIGSEFIFMTFTNLLLKEGFAAIFSR